MDEKYKELIGLHMWYVDLYRKYKLSPDGEISSIEKDEFGFYKVFHRPEEQDYDYFSKEEMDELVGGKVLCVRHVLNEPKGFYFIGELVNMYVGDKKVSFTKDSVTI